MRPTIFFIALIFFTSVTLTLKAQRFIGYGGRQIKASKEARFGSSIGGVEDICFAKLDGNILLRVRIGVGNLCPFLGSGTQKIKKVYLFLTEGVTIELGNSNYNEKVDSDEYFFYTISNINVDLLRKHDIRNIKCLLSCDNSYINGEIGSFSGVPIYITSEIISEFLDK